ncbi:hypothetical protein [Nocardioides perillae]|uniref:Uncharacterized protein n=1 Tax=Nocardioides perillae TaxID=1119534 RepID=A0A7Y9RWB2_9ACTN|nr:hypothetical protein [Nocardioides perillae]NYG55160.1 hypothetical protein [Nocardioides perillae]
MVVHTVLGSGDTAAVEAGLLRLVEDVRAQGVSTYVVLVQEPVGLAAEDPAADLALRVRAAAEQRGEDAVAVVVGFPGELLAVETTGLPLSATEVSLEAYDAREQVRTGLPDDPEGLAVRPTTAGEAAATLSALTGLREADPDAAEDRLPDLDAGTVGALREEPWVQRIEGYDPDADSWTTEPGTGLVVGTAVAVALLPVAWRLLRARRAVPTRSAARGGRARAGAAPDERALAAADLRRLDGALARGRPRGTTEAQWQQRRDLAARAHDEAARLLEDPRARQVDLVGARVLAQVGLASLAGRPAYHPCFVDPRHGAASTTIRAGGEVPACGSCAATARAGRAPAPLRRRTGLLRRDRPYWESDDVWGRTGLGALTDDLPAEVAADRRGEGR